MATARSASIAAPRWVSCCRKWPPSDDTLHDVVLEADIERHSLMREAETAKTRTASARSTSASARHRRLVGRGARGRNARRARLPAERPVSARRGNSPAAGACARRLPACCSPSRTSCCSTSRRTISTLKAPPGLKTTCANIRTPCIIVSHDRELLNRSVTHIARARNTRNSSMQAGRLRRPTCSLRAANARQQLAAQKAKQDAERAHLQAFVDRFRAKASKARQGAKPRQDAREDDRMSRSRWPSARSRSSFYERRLNSRRRCSETRRAQTWAMAHGQAESWSGVDIAPRFRRPHRHRRRQRAGQDDAGEIHRCSACRCWQGVGCASKSRPHRLFQPGPARRTARRRNRARSRQATCCRTHAARRSTLARRADGLRPREGRDQGRGCPAARRCAC
jgi:hypothetical protein